MYSDENKEQIIELINTCKGLINAEPHVYQDGSKYGIEFTGYQTLIISVDPVFDMSEREVSALINLMARALPIMTTLIEENNRKEAKIEALMDAIATISLIAGEKMRRIEGVEIIYEEEKEFPTVGEEQ